MEWKLGEFKSRECEYEVRVENSQTESGGTFKVMVGRRAAVRNMVTLSEKLCASNAHCKWNYVQEGPQVYTTVRVHWGLNL